MARFAGVSTPALILVLLLHIQGDTLKVHIPTLIPSIAARRDQIEAINETLFIDRDVYSAADQIYLCWPDEILNGGQPPYGQDAHLLICKWTHLRAGGLLRFGTREKFPDEAKNAIGECALNFRCWQDEPGQDLLAFEVESRQILCHTCAILAGRCYPQQIFSNSDLTGE